MVVTSCKDTTINQHAGGNAEACVEGSLCTASASGGSGDAAEPSRAGTDDSTSGDSTPAGSAPGDSASDNMRASDGGANGGTGTDTGPGDGSDSDSGDGGSTGSVEGTPAPVKVVLSGGNLPEGLRDSTDGCYLGTCTDWNVADVVVGDTSFDTGLVVHCSIGCDSTETGWFQVRLGGRYAKLDATFGMAADSPGTDPTRTLTVKVTDQGTGKVLCAKTLVRGTSYTVKGLDIRHVGLLRITFDGALGGTYGAVGAPVVRG
ncbi:hypothetical protein KUM39_23750 [Streptomyces sp. J2-1]|uniref:hypothetical protein n=1 Tax=Streptomyces corallincola TaxID=2851888 RepID=UPI001C390651|nr:hypothetical protein [Streptomyces corallincola]MBV2357349.1 hypothetical protein [Streptomyces corallincola]